MAPPGEGEGLLVLYMFGQALELPECDGAVPDGAVPDGAVVEGVVVDGVVDVAAGVVLTPDEPVAAFAIATTPPASAPVQASVTSSFLACVLMLDLLSQVGVLSFVLCVSQ
jgi:hypothetical protein